ncbi:putative ABC transport system permease protein [Algoriphagus boseongensis]|uniref:Putative ABC transport system permease protein n=1 Tax=Algoriphagus boseongensis TaxID=1442587 RepID=A0A4R6T8K6_9BACT|nr:ABC transporter permease [Algoriphagus boseongensis]TDQ18493.1 putative ABC transport system permease protein [Algoriphagus boseongensis]
MWKNYLTVALRNLKRNKIYSAINIIGLGLGMAASILIALFVLDELSYDQFIPNGKRIYRANVSGKMNGNEFTTSTSATPMAPTMLNELPQVEDAVRFGLMRTFLFRLEEKAFTEPIVLAADPNFIDFFGLQMLKGDPKTALVGPDRVVLTQSVAEKYFGTEDPVGQSIFSGSENKPLEVTGVVADFPSNSHLDFDAIISGENFWYFEQENWTSNNIYTYYRLAEGTDPQQIQQAINGFVEKYVAEEILAFLGIPLKTFQEQGNDYGIQTMPLHDIYLNSNTNDEIKAPGNAQYLILFTGIAVFILLIACINFMNLATARSANRAKEVGVRKSIGADKGRLIGQFLAESLLYCVFAGVLALVIILVLLKPFNVLAGKELGFGFLIQPQFLLAFVLFLLLVGLMAGSYPAFYLTSFSPVTVLKGKLRGGVKRSGLRSSLVVFQFFISTILIISSMVVYKQLGYMQSKNLGFDKENVLSLLHVRALGTNQETFKQELLSQTGFLEASYANNLPPKLDWNSVMRTKDKQQDILCNINVVDEDHLKTLGFKLASGRFFSKEITADTGSILINKAALAQMGWTELDGSQEIGGFWSEDGSVTYRKVIGVLEDFNYETLRQNVRPLVMMLGTRNDFNEMAIRLSPGNYAEQIEVLEQIWKKHSGGAPFEYSFLDADFNLLFQKEQKMGNIILIFTVLAIGIACLGLFGLAAYTTEQRSKEISIRKALGASMLNLVTILSKDFTLLVLIAFVLGGPLSYYLLEKYWLQNFAYRTEIGLGMILIAGLISIFIAWLTVSYQSFKTAASNPVDYLKNE